MCWNCDRGDVNRDTGSLWNTTRRPKLSEFPQTRSLAQYQMPPPQIRDVEDANEWFWEAWHSDVKLGDIKQRNGGARWQLSFRPHRTLDRQLPFKYGSQPTLKSLSNLGSCFNHGAFPTVGTSHGGLRQGLEFDTLCKYPREMEAGQ